MNIVFWNHTYFKSRYWRPSALRKLQIPRRCMPLGLKQCTLRSVAFSGADTKIFIFCGAGRSCKNVYVLNLLKSQPIAILTTRLHLLPVLREGSSTGVPTSVGRQAILLSQCLASSDVRFHDALLCSFVILSSFSTFSTTFEKKQNFVQVLSFILFILTTKRKWNSGAAVSDLGSGNCLTTQKMPQTVQDVLGPIQII